MTHPLILVILAAIVVGACADRSAVRLGGNMARVDVSAAPIYGAQGATDMALKLAAEETLASGFTHFVVADYDGRFDAQTVGVLPGHSTLSGSWTPSYGGIRGSAVGPSPIVRARNERSMIIAMMHADDPRSEGAYDAQAILSR